ncbi:trafficking protein particle complex subunit 2-like protein isoform X1 [Lynx rufus]|uniref:trafficking protein particle complex subunit 2-like protein isoform X1 n=1 Tax=Lynx rufus TaxID=61384 RepID=UPI001F123FDA|nr:trafficking protein particle complex subunit 2-like protein isoform X1 [Lynx rufus]XP_046934882.1 trafficking protein particle complex subunit 2-like protein isoform X1 [Lynx rufus]
MRVCSCDSLVLVVRVPRGRVLVVCAHGADPHRLSCRHPFLQNYPLYIRSAPTENELKFHYMVHTSLDVVDEKISAMGKALVDQRELYLGLLYPTEDYKVYGYVTNSKVKFVMVVDSSNTALRDNEIRSMFRKLHNSYTDVMCNPFYNPGDRIQSRAFDSMVTSMMIQVC